MKRFEIIHKETGAIICRSKRRDVSYSRHYRRADGDIGEDFEIVRTTKGRAEREAEWLNKNYYKGWEIRAVEE